MKISYEIMSSAHARQLTVSFKLLSVERIKN